MSSQLTLSPNDIIIPSSTQTVTVKAIEAFSRLAAPSTPFYAASPGGTTNDINAGPGFAFLLEHKSSGRRVVFDLGVRKDVESLPPAFASILKAHTGEIDAIINEDVATTLSKGGVGLDTIEAVIWSHHHPDHSGDMTTFPASTALVLGPESLTHFRPAYPLDPNAWNLESDFVGREVKEIQFDGPIIGGYPTHDYFGDGSFFLIDAPGHCLGHMMGLARVTAEPATFILFGADAAHHIAQLRPSPFLPLPQELVASLPEGLQNVGAPVHKSPFLSIPPTGVSIHRDRDAAFAVVQSPQAYDARPDIWVILSHDGSIHLEAPGVSNDQQGVPAFPAELNLWKEKGWKDVTRWAFLEKGNHHNIW